DRRLRHVAQHQGADLAGLFRAAGRLFAGGAGRSLPRLRPDRSGPETRCIGEVRMNVGAGFIGLAVFFVLIALKVPVAIALALVAFGGIWAMFGIQPAIGILASTPYDFVASWTLSAVPMFLLMGFIAYYSGLTGGLFDAAKLGLRKLPGGLGIAAILACSGFAAVCGSSLATAASMGRIAIPEMIKAGYKP